MRTKISSWSCVLVARVVADVVRRQFGVDRLQRGDAGLHPLHERLRGVLQVLQDRRRNLDARLRRQHGECNLPLLGPLHLAVKRPVYEVVVVHVRIHVSPPFLLVRYTRHRNTYDNTCLKMWCRVFRDIQHR